MLNLRRALLPILILTLLPGLLWARKSLISQGEIRQLEKSGHLVPAGDDSWKTRGGLLITGRDPKGNTRLEHIMRHSADIPGRPVHGVFALSKAQIIELMDEAWKKARSGSLRQESRGGNVSYLYNAKRKIGYLGGRSGSRSGNPPIYSVLLVVRKGTAEVVTFFPK